MFQVPHGPTPALRYADVLMASSKCYCMCSIIQKLPKVTGCSHLLWLVSWKQLQVQHSHECAQTSRPSLKMYSIEMQQRHGCCELRRMRAYAILLISSRLMFSCPRHVKCNLMELNTSFGQPCTVCQVAWQSFAEDVWSLSNANPDTAWEHQGSLPGTWITVNVSCATTCAKTSRGTRLGVKAYL